MKRIADRQFLSLFDDRRESRFENLQFERCVFTNCVLAQSTDPAQRSQVRNVQLTNCQAVGCSIGPALLENVVVDGLATADLLIVWGALFRHVTLKGRIGSLKLNAYPDIDERNKALALPFDQARAKFYDATDWALDISGAICGSFDATGIPARLFLRDPVTQAVVRRSNVEQGNWRRKVPAWNRHWVDVLDVIFDDEAPEDTVLVAPKAARKAKLQTLIEGLDNLRQLGVADPD